MDGAGKTTLIKALSSSLGIDKVATIHLPHANFVKAALGTSGGGTPFGDPWTDRLIFALDNRLVAYELKKLEANKQCNILLMQRGWMDSYIYGAVQDFTYEEIDSLMKTKELPKPDCSIYLTCDPNIAYERVADDSKADKFETRSFMQQQHQETERFYKALQTDKRLRHLFDEPTLYLDTSNLSKEEVQLKVLEYLRQNILH